MDRIDSAVLAQSTGYTPLGALTEPNNVKKTESLPFTIRVVNGAADLEQAVEMRRSAYRRHMPEFAETMGIEPLDAAPGTTVLLAQSRLDGGPLGTVRIQTNTFGPLAVEQSLRMPDWMNQASIAEATRLGVASGAIGRMVKVALCKAFYMHCVQNGIEWMLITARSPIDREYQAMLFEDLYGKHEFLPMAHVGGIPHRVLVKPVASVQPHWATANHPFFKFFFETDHPDIDIGTASKQGKGAPRYEMNEA